MLKKMLLAACVAAATIMPCQAQFFPKDTYGGGNTKADATFSLCDRCINLRHKAVLGGGNSITIEMYKHTGYALILDIESVLSALSDDSRFVADSAKACPQCNYRLDYLLLANGARSYRLRKYEPQGTFLYQKTGEDLKPFKPEYDTLHLFIKGPAPALPGIGEACQVTLVLNRMANLDSLLAQKGRLNHIVDTMRQVSAPKTKAQERNWYRGSTIVLTKNYRDTAKMMLYQHRGITKEGAESFSYHSAFDVQANVGAGFLRDHLAPAAELGLVYRLPSTRGDNIGELLIGAYLSDYFAFARNSEGKYDVQQNVFANVEFGGESDNGDNIYGLKFRRFTLGAGYLITSQGDYFTGTTMKLFTNIRLRNGFTLSPEIIATDNFHQVFPGLTLKVF